jgi:hypothetical protein
MWRDLARCPLPTGLIGHGRRGGPGQDRAVPQPANGPAILGSPGVCTAGPGTPAPGRAGRVRRGTEGRLMERHLSRPLLAGLRATGGSAARQLPARRLAGAAAPRGRRAA